MLDNFPALGIAGSTGCGKSTLMGLLAIVFDTYPRVVFGQMKAGLSRELYNRIRDSLE